MCHIAILAGDGAARARLRRWTEEVCAARGLFVPAEAPEALESYYYRALDAPPLAVVAALPGVAGLNAAEHIRRLCPACGLVWFSDLDFALQAYRLRADYFSTGPPGRAELAEGLGRWLDRRQGEHKGA